MKKKFMYVLVSCLLSVSFCVNAFAVESKKCFLDDEPLGAIASDQFTVFLSNEEIDGQVIAEDSFTVYLETEKERLVYPVQVSTKILYLESDGLGFYVTAYTGVPIITGLHGNIEYNTSLDADHGISQTYSVSLKQPDYSILWMEYNGKHFSSGVKITASFWGMVEGQIDGEDKISDGYFFRTVTGIVP